MVWLGLFEPTFHTISTGRLHICLHSVDRVDNLLISESVPAGF